MKQSLDFTVLSMLVACLLLLLQAGCATRPASPATPTALQRLQGTWEGGMLGQVKRKADAEDQKGELGWLDDVVRLSGPSREEVVVEKITMTFTGNSLHYYRDEKFWFDTTFTLPENTHPAQLHATIRQSAPPDDLKGSVVFAIWKIEDGTLTLALNQGGGEEDLPKNFDPTDNPAEARYEFRKVQGKKSGPRRPADSESPK